MTDIKIHNFTIVFRLEGRDIADVELNIPVIPETGDIVRFNKSGLWGDALVVIGKSHHISEGKTMITVYLTYADPTKNREATEGPTETPADIPTSERIVDAVQPIGSRHGWVYQYPNSQQNITEAFIEASGGSVVVGGTIEGTRFNMMGLTEEDAYSLCASFIESMGGKVVCK